MSAIQQYDWDQLDPAQREQLLARPALKNNQHISQRVEGIIAQVRGNGDMALRALTRELDGVAIDRIEVTADELAAAGATLDASARQAIDLAAGNIRRFHAAQIPLPIRVETTPGVCCERLTRPLARVGLYVPAGSAPLPSTALMLGIPAMLAGCNTRILCSPPQPDGHVAPAVLYAAQVAGITQVFKLGGAQAIAALAYGTESVPKVDKIFGPGNAWVTAAKDLVDRDPQGAARDFPAGPSEVLVIADGTVDPRFAAADLLSQAEHGVDSQALLLTPSAAVAAETAAAIECQLAQLSRRGIITEALRHSSIIRVRDLATAFEVANTYAPEHLILQLAEPRNWVEHVQAAGSVFLGPWAAEAFGDYTSGTNHVLPTYGYARRCSSLGVDAFCRSMSVQEMTLDGLVALGPATETLASLEGLDAHRQAVSVRLAAAIGAMRDETRT